MGLVFGVYTSKAFYTPKINETSSADEDAYVFSVSKKTKHLQYTCKQHAIISYNEDRVFSFGAGFDISIFEKCNSNKNSYTRFGSTYKPANGHNFNSPEATTYLAGEREFKVTEVEVYSVKFIE